VANILSQEEIDALLGAVDSTEEEQAKEEPAEEKPAQQSSVMPYDFRRPNRVSKEQLRFFQTIHEDFSRQFANSLSGYLRTMVDIEVVSTDQLTYGEYVLSLPASTALFVFAMDPLEASGVMEINPSLILTMVDRLFGGEGAESSTSRDLTGIETAVVTKLVTEGLGVMTRTWERVTSLNCSMSELMKNPQMLQLMPNTETVILITLELRMGESAGILSLCYPFAAMESVIPNISSRQILMGSQRKVVEEGPQWITQTLGESNLSVAAELGRSELTVSEFIRLRPGDVIPLLSRVEDPICVLVGNERKGLARPGLKGRYRAVRLETPIGKGESKDES